MLNSLQTFFTETKLHCDIIVKEIPKPEAKATDVPSPQSIDVVDTSASETVINEPESVASVEKEKIDIDAKSKFKTIQETSKCKTVQTSKPEELQETPKPIVKDAVEKMDTESKNVLETKTKSTKEESKPKIIKEIFNPESAKESNIKASDIEEIVTDPTAPITSKPVKAVATVLKSEDVKKMDTASTEVSEQETVKPVRTRKRANSTSSSFKVETKDDVPKTPTTRKRAQFRAQSVEVGISTETIEGPTSSVSEIEPQTPTTRKRALSRAKSIDIDKESNEPTNIDEPKTPSTRKRTAKTDVETPKVIEQVIASGKTEEAAEPKTPITRKRAQSNQSEEASPENVTPSRRKTPTTEVRKIITRRMSREMKELDDSNRPLDESATPNRRTRNADDNESVASGSSMASSVQSGEGKRRGRKSTVATKPDLSVIPEAIAEGHSAHGNIDEYSGARR